MFLFKNKFYPILYIYLIDFILCCRAAQKLNLSSPHRRKRHSSGEDEGAPLFRTDFSGALARSPPPVPPALLRRIGVREVSTVGKVGHTMLFSIFRDQHERDELLSAVSKQRKLPQRARERDNLITFSKVASHVRASARRYDK